MALHKPATALGKGEPTKTRQKTNITPAAVDAFKSVTFLATIPPVAGALDGHGDGGGRVKLDVPENNMGAFMQLFALRGKVLRVTITESAN